MVKINRKKDAPDLKSLHDHCLQDNVIYLMRGHGGDDFIVEVVGTEYRATSASSNLSCRWQVINPSLLFILLGEIELTLVEDHGQ
jgi:hypothetical protein